MIIDMTGTEIDMTSTESFNRSVIRLNEDTPETIRRKVERVTDPDLFSFDAELMDSQIDGLTDLIIRGEYHTELAGHYRDAMGIITL